MLTDSNKGITSIEYNMLDLPQCIKTKPRIIFKENADNAIYYTYSADGTKLRATYKEADSRTMPYKPNTSYNNNTGININTSGMVTPSVKPLESNYHYCSNLVYNNDRLSTILFDGGYIGKELDTMYGWNMQDHQARWYSIENITWSVIDAKSEINYSISPYAY